MHSRNSEVPRPSLRPLIPLALFLPVALVLIWPSVEGVFADPPVRDFFVDARAVALADPESALPVETEGAWQQVAGGLSAADPDDAAVIVSVPGGAWDTGRILISAAPGSRWAAALVREDPEAGAIVRQLLLPPLETDQARELDAEQIPAGPAAGQPMTLRLRPVETGAAGGDTPLLRGVRVRFGQQAAAPVPWLPDYVGMALMPLAVGLMLLFNGRFSETRAVAGGLGAGLLLVLFRGQVATAEGTVFLFLVAAVAVAATGAWRRSLAPPSYSEPPDPEAADRARALHRRAAVVLAGAVITLIAFYTRWEAFIEARRLPLGWDASGYREIALSGGALYATAQSFAPWVREPLFPWLLRGWFAVLPDTEASARLAGLVLSCGAVALVYAVGVRLFPVFVGAVAAAGLALEPEHALLGVRVLRHDLLVILLMGAVLAREFLADKPWVRAAAWGLLTAGLALTQLGMLPVAIALAAWEGVRTRWRAPEAGLALLLAIVPLTPHLLYNARAGDGDPFYSASVHTRFYLNQEFAGEEGFPTAEEVAADPYAGERVGVLSYYFEYHSVPEVILGHIRGYWNMFVWHAPRVQFFGGHEWLMLPGLFGAWVLLRDPRRRWVFGWFVLAALPVAFIHRSGADWRLGAHVHPLVLWIWALGVWPALEAARRGIGRAVKKRLGAGPTPQPEEPVS